MTVFGKQCEIMTFLENIIFHATKSFFMTFHTRGTLYMVLQSNDAWNFKKNLI